MNSDIDYIEEQLRLTRKATAPWPPLSGHILNAYTRLESLRTVIPPVPPSPPVGGPPVPVGTLLFSDDFDGTQINTHKWEGKGATKVYHAPSGTLWKGLEHAALDGNSNLVITAQKVNGVWESSFLAALASNDFSYKGPRYVEARVKVPSGTGTFPACPWEWAAPWGAGPIEIDYMEILGKEITKLHTTVHPWLPAGDHPVGNANDTGVDLSLDFHRYGGVVHSSYVSFYLDGVFVWTADMLRSGLEDLTSYPVVPCIDLDMGGWGGPIDPALTSASMLVDYVKVWAL